MPGHEATDHKRKSNAGRKRKISPARLDLLCKSISEGNYIKTACVASGISEKTYYKYVRQGDADVELGLDTYFSQFVLATKKAEAEGERALIAIIVTAAKSKLPGSWQAAAWMLERKDPAHFGRRMEIEVTPSKLIEELRARSQELAQMKQGSITVVTTPLLTEAVTPRGRARSTSKASEGIIE